MSFLSKVGGGIKGLVKRSVASATGGVIAGGGGATALSLPEDLIALVAAVTALSAAVGNLLREYYAYREKMKVGS